MFSTHRQPSHPTSSMNRAASISLWLLIAFLGAGAYGGIAFNRGEPINSGYLLVAAICTYAIGYRFYSKWIAAKVLALDDRRATPCEIHEDGRDFVKTNKWIVFGHHFAAISGPGPLVGPVLAAQFGYLPGTLWILIGVVLGGAVQDFIILAASMRRDGRSLAQMLRDELNTTVGRLGLAAILAIMIILLAVLALVVVKAMGESSWSVFTVGATIPIALFMGCYLRFIRVGKVLEVSAIGVVLLLLAVWGGQNVHASAYWSSVFRLSEEQVAWGVIGYGFLASVLPVWLLLAPRDYLSTFMKLGTILALAVGTLLVLPVLQMPALTKFVDGSGFVVPGKMFPFCFIVIACGAISGFHTLIASGITPKIIARETHARSVGYGGMCLESLVALMALIAACTLPPGQYLAINSAGTPDATIARVQNSGFTMLAPDGQGGWKNVPVTVTKEEMDQLAKTMGENSLYGRTGGAPTFAVGMASLFARFTGGLGTDLWYHFALMFEALFILTTLDAGTRVGRYLLQDTMGRVSPRLGDTKSIGAGIFASGLIVAAWGFFLIAGVRDPNGGVKALWPIFGIANQLLASIALCLGTTIILKTQLRRRASPALALVTLIPLAWLLTVTMTAGLQKIFHQEDDAKRERIGFMQIAREAEAKRPALLQAAQQAADPAARVAAEKALSANATVQFNNWLDTGITGVFLAFVAVIFALCAWEWLRLLRGTKLPTSSETEPVYLPAEAGAPPGSSMGIVALSALMLKELSGEAAIERERQSQVCECAKEPTKARRNVYLSVTERQFKSPNRCC